MENNLNTIIIKGLSWNFIETLILFTTRFIIGIILARILAPSDFGLIGMTIIFISISDVFVKAGFGQAFIRKKDTKEIDANTVFLINLFTALAIYIIVFLTAPLISDFFHEPKLVNITRVLCLMIIINSLNVIQYAFIRKQMLFKRKAILTIISSISSGIIGIICAYKGLGVWSLVVQQLMNRMVLCILFYSYSTWKPKLQFSFDIARSMFSYGSWLLLADVFATTLNNLYRFVIGHFTSASELGYYERAHQFQSMVADTFTWVFGMVAFPSFTKVQDDYRKMLNLAEKFVQYSTLVIYPTLCILAIIANPLISILLTDKWLPAVPYLQLFCITGIIIPINFFLSPYIQSAGFSRLSFMSDFFVGFLRIINVLLTFKWGIKALIIGDFFVLLINFIVFSFISARKMRCNYIKVLWGVKETVIITFLCGLIGGYSAFWVSDSNVWLRLIIPTLVISSSYIALTFLFNRKVFSQTIKYMKKTF